MLNLSPFQTIQRVVEGDYDANPLRVDPIVISWAADSISDTAQAKRELKALNSKRERLGFAPCVFPWGHRLF